jgi:ParB family chromosome partitioning protein
VDKEKRRLGRGLDALLGNTDNVAYPVPPGKSTEIAVDQIEPNPLQPRKAIDEDELSRLSASVRVHGILQPLVVRPVGDRYQLVAGERRLRAAQAAGLSSVPVHVVDFNDQQTLEAALVENIQRTDLNPIEKAQGFKEYLDRFQMSQEQLAERLGLARPTVSNFVGLLDLTPEVQEAVRLNQITLGHAKIIKGIKDAHRQAAMCKQIIAQGLSVHATELAFKEQKVEPKPARALEEKVAEEKTAHVRAIEDELRQRFASRVEIRLKGKDKGQIILTFDSNDDFMRLVDYLRK